MMGPVSMFLAILFVAGVSSIPSCPEDVFSYHQNEEIQSQFYICNYGNLVGLDCGVGMEFDFDTEICVSNLLREKNAYVPECLPGQNDLLPHETDCTKFYSCSNGVLIELSCPLGTEFNPTTQMCDFPTPGGCLSQSTTTDSSNITTTQNYTTTEDWISTTNWTTTEDWTTTVNWTTTDKTTTVTTPKPGPCANNTGINLIPHENKCDSFYVCVEETASELSCPAGQEFNPIQKECVVISPNGCFANQNVTTVTPPYNPCRGNKGTTYLPHEYDCNKFYICFDDKPVDVVCPENMEFSPASKGCVDISNNGCTSKLTTTSTARTTTAGTSFFETYFF